MIRLETFTEVDFSRLIKWIDSPEFLIQWGDWRFTYPLDENQLKEYLVDAKDEDPTRMAFKAINIESNEVIGHIELNKISKNNGTASICRVLVGPANLRGKGFGSAMVREALSIGFEQLGLQKIDLQVYEFNKRAIACYERTGFSREGLLRRFRKVSDEYWNLVWMSMLRKEWEQCKNKKEGT
jgi:RimJ/RimL family protein N-acetyltransferase